MTKYYTLAIREEGEWSAQFGDYDRECVEQELEDSLDSCSWPNLKRKDCKVITTGDSQADIEAAIKQLNEGSK